MGGLQTKPQIPSVKCKKKLTMAILIATEIKPIGSTNPTWAVRMSSFVVFLMFCLLLIFCGDYESRHSVKWETFSKMQ